MSGISLRKNGGKYKGNGGSVGRPPQGVSYIDLESIIMYIKLYKDHNSGL